MAGLSIPTMDGVRYAYFSADGTTTVGSFTPRLAAVSSINNSAGDITLSTLTGRAPPWYLTSSAGQRNENNATGVGYADISGNTGVDIGTMAISASGTPVCLFVGDMVLRNVSGVGYGSFSAQTGIDVDSLTRTGSYTFTQPAETSRPSTTTPPMKSTQAAITLP